MPLSKILLLPFDDEGQDKSLMPAKNKTDKCGQFYPNFKPPKKHGMKLKPTTRTKLYRSFPAL